MTSFVKVALSVREEAAAAALNPLNILTGGLYSGITGAGGTANTIGSAVGLLGNSKPTEEDIDRSTIGTRAASWLVPGMGSYRAAKRRRAVSQALTNNKTTGRSWSEALLMPALPLAGTALGTIGGGILGAGTPDGALTGALRGAGTGLIAGTVPNAIGSLAALLSRKRTIDEQQAYENRSGARHLIPGMAAYDYWKSIGVADDVLRNQAARQEPKKQEPEQPKTASIRDYML